MEERVSRREGYWLTQKSGRLQPESDGGDRKENVEVSLRQLILPAGQKLIQNFPTGRGGEARMELRKTEHRRKKANGENN